jgi:hypothetical protein
MDIVIVKVCFQTGIHLFIDGTGFACGTKGGDNNRGGMVGLLLFAALLTVVFHLP